MFVALKISKLFHGSFSDVSVQDNQVGAFT